MRFWDNALRLSFAILILAGAAKLFATAGAAPIIDEVDYVTQVQNRTLFTVAGILETTLGTAGLLIRNRRAQSAILAFCVCSFAAYRVAVTIVHPPTACPCLGNLTDTLHLSPFASAVLTNALFSWLVLTLFGVILHTRKANEATGMKIQAEI